MQYGKNLEAFLVANKPEKIEEIPAPKMVQGSSVIPKDDSVVIRMYESGTAFFDLCVEKTLSVWWKTAVSSGNKAIFTPTLDYIRANMPNEKREAISQLVLNQLGIKPKEVELPERVIQFPIPSWVDANCCNECVSSAYPTSKLCFASEAREMLTEFEKELGKAKEELK